MRLLATFIGSSICGALAFGIWPEMWKSYGIMGGWLSAAALVGTCWYMNHRLGVIWNDTGRIWVDQAWAVFASGLAWCVVRFGSQIMRAIPAIVCCAIGGSLAGLAAYLVKKHIPAFAGEARSAQDGNSGAV